MSKIIATKSYLIATAVGNIKVVGELLVEFDVEDIIRSQAESQAKLVQLVNIGKEINSSAILPKEVLPSIFRNNEEAL